MHVGLHDASGVFAVQGFVRIPQAAFEGVVKQIVKQVLTENHRQHKSILPFEKCLRAFSEVSCGSGSTEHPSWGCTVETLVLNDLLPWYGSYYTRFVSTVKRRVLMFKFCSHFFDGGY